MWHLCCTVILLAYPALSLPSTHSFVTSTISSTTFEIDKFEEDNATRPIGLNIYEMYINANVTNRFSHTLISSKVKNFEMTPKEAIFSVVLPETAYISGFVLEIDGIKYEAYVREKEEAKNIYDEAIRSGLSAAHVAASARDSNRFDISVTVEPQKKAAFYLSYEELLQRERDQYEVVINIHPGQLVKDLRVTVNINESRPLRFVKVPSIRSGNEIKTYTNHELDSQAIITHIDEATAIISFQPTSERQKELAHGLQTDENEGLAGQFVVQYDVLRDSNGGEVLLQDGYFVHFFSPVDIQPLPKHVVFVLDTSGSMYHTKIQQLKQAMYSILGELKENDLFSLIEFNSVVSTWNLDNNTISVFPRGYSGWGEVHDNIESIKLPPSFKVNEETLAKAKAVIHNFDANGGTNIYSALKIALRVVKLATNQNESSNRQPLIIFLTDGEPTVDVTNTERIISDITTLNLENEKIPIISLSFGDGADKNFLQRLSLQNCGFSRHIYEAADASLQLTDFYSQISSPLLTNVKFKYTSSVSNLTNTQFSIFFGGSELVVSGRIDENFDVLPKVEAFGIKGLVELHPQIIKPVTYLEKLWAYLSIKQLLDARKVSQNKNRLEKEAIGLALRYSFVTPVTSLVVVKPNNTNRIVNAVAADSALIPTPVLSTTYSLSRRPSQSLLPRLATGRDFTTFSQNVPLQPRHYYPRNYATSNTNLFAKPLIRKNKQKPTKLKLQQLQTQIPWLSTVLNKDNETITLSNGVYSLGLNETISVEQLCTESHLHQMGSCKLLQDCPTIYNYLTNLDVYEQYFCILNGYAGICCSKT